MYIKTQNYLVPFNTRNKLSLNSLIFSSIILLKMRAIAKGFYKTHVATEI